MTVRKPTRPQTAWAVYSRARVRAAVLTRPVDDNVDVLGSAADKISKDKRYFSFSFSFTFLFPFF